LIKPDESTAHAYAGLYEHTWRAPPYANSRRGDAARAGRRGGRLAVRPLARQAQSVLALPTGATPLGLYSELIARSRAGTVNVDAARIFNLDEYCGLPQSDPHSYAAFLHEHLIAPAGIAATHVRLLRGDAADMEAECATTMRR